MPWEWFEIGDEDNNSEDHGNGNIELIKKIKWASFDKSVHDARMLPYDVVQKLYEWHIDIHGLIPAGLAIDKKTIK